MSQAQFEDFMSAQFEAIAQSGMEPEEWIEKNAEEFRATWEASHHA